jgi:hypothetical protein
MRLALDHDIFAPMSAPAVMDDSDDEIETCACELESECPHLSQHTKLWELSRSLLNAMMHVFYMKK